MSDWSKRYLCPDGACVGVIGPDGKCKVCGKEASGFGLQTPASEEADEDSADDENEDDSDMGEDEDDSGRSPEPEARSPGAEGAGEWDQRQLCPDGACVGVIHEGKCNVCGRSAA